MLTFILSKITLETLIIAIAGYVIVFLALVVLFWFFNFLPKIIYSRKKKKHTRQGKPVPGDEKITGEEIAAISAALHLYFSELHDEESGVLTIKKVSKAYSPWSSKIYGVRNQFNRN